MMTTHDDDSLSTNVYLITSIEYQCVPLRYAAQLKAALSGSETNDRRVCRILGAHDKDEVKAIALAFEKKYNETLARVLTATLKGNYKRLAVAWIDLPDQLGQPQKKIEVPSKAEDAGAIAGAIALSSGFHKATELDNEISEDDELISRDHKPSDPLYRAKVGMWTSKYRKYAS